MQNSEKIYKNNTQQNKSTPDSSYTYNSSKLNEIEEYNRYDTYLIWVKLSSELFGEICPIEKTKTTKELIDIAL